MFLATLSGVLSAIGTKAPHEVTRADCVALLWKLEARGAAVMLRRLRMWLRQMFEFGIDDERRPLLKNLVVPTGHLTRFKRDKRGRVPAITDAVYKATGVRVRSLPTTLDKVLKLDEASVTSADSRHPAG